MSLQEIKELINFCRMSNVQFIETNGVKISLYPNMNQDSLNEIKYPQPELP